MYGYTLTCTVVQLYNSVGVGLIVKQFRAALVAVLRGFPASVPQGRALAPSREVKSELVLLTKLIEAQ